MTDPSGPAVADDSDASDPTGGGAERPVPHPPPAPETGPVPVDDTGTVAPADQAETVRLERAEGELAGPTDGASHHSQDALESGDGRDDHDDDEDLDDEDEGEGSGRKRGGLLTKQVQVDARMILAIVAVLALFAGAYVLGQRQGKSGSPGATKPTTASTAAALPVPKDFMKFEDKETGVSLSYPKDWTQFSTKDLDASYRLLVGVPNAKDNLRVRVNAYSKEVTKANVGDQKAVIDAIFTDEKVNIISANAVELNGLPALFYVYKFTDSTGTPGYHAHFFVFQGRKMVSLVFEAVPEARYAQLAEVFDKVANSLQITPGDPPASLEPITGATVPGATTVPTTTGPPTTVKP